MRWLRLFFDPTGRIDGRAFFVGLLGMLGLSIATAVLVNGSPTLALALLPIVSELAVTELFHGPVQGLDTATMAGFGLILAVRAYILACLCIKRLRDQGRTLDGLVAMAVVTLMAHVVAGARQPDTDIEAFFPFVAWLADVLGLAVLWAGFLVLMARAPTYASSRLQVKPAS